MKAILNIVRWVFFVLFVVLTIFAISCGGWGFLGAILFAFCAILIMPTTFSAKLREKLKLNKIVSAIMASIMFFVGVLIVPTDEIEDSNASIESSDVEFSESQYEQFESSETISSTEISDSTEISESSVHDESTESIESSELEASSEPEASNEPEVSSEPEESNEPEESSKTDEDSETAHTHNFSDATCEAPATCACGATNGKALGHDYSKATCTEPAKCIRCNKTNGTANGHTWLDATYDAPQTCQTCGATQGNALDVPNKENYHGHVYTGGDSSTKYHYEADCAGKYSHEITWEEVKKRNLDPCTKCVLN